MPRERAQSETLGFVLVFALIVASIGIVFTVGFSGLQDVRDTERVNNAERAFEVMADNLEDITQRGAPSRATEIKLADARLSVEGPTEVSVNVPDGGFNATYRVRPIVYDADTGESIVYEQGAVLRTSAGGGVVLHESVLLMNESRTVIPVVQTRLSGNGGVSGSGTVLVRADHVETALEYDNSSSNTVWLNVTSPRAEEWRSHLDEKPDVTCEPRSGNTTSCSVSTGSVHVTVVRIDVSLD